MDSQKTGRVIAERRAERGMTQKQLAERLHISDRTVSRWERGVGFPDLSLLEPLADTLELSVLELLRGERIIPQEQLADASERSVREAFRSLGLRLKRFQRLLIVLAVLLALAAGVLGWLAANSIQNSVFTMEALTSAQATAICPDILITTGEYELLAELLEREEIQSLFSDRAAVTMDAAFSAPYQSRVSVDGQTPDHFQISVIGHSVHLDYSAGLARRILTIYTTESRVEKYAAAYPNEPEAITGPDPNGEMTTIFLRPDPIYILSNEDNAQFSQAVSRPDPPEP